MLTDPRLGTTLPALITSLYDYLTRIARSVNGLDNRVRTGSGSPENVVEAPVGTLYLRTDGGTDTTLYVKESGTGSTGWAAI